jgi:hypothetical protein
MKPIRTGAILIMTLASVCTFLASCAKPRAKNAPIITTIYTADPSAHVFDGKLYVYPSHDIKTDKKYRGDGDQYDMVDYHVLSLASPDAVAVDNGIALDVKDVPWASQQMWAPDAAFKDVTYFLYFPAKDKEGIFRIGVATSKSPTGPFAAKAEPIKGSFSMDPAVFTDDDGKSYMVFGGLWGGQLESWATGSYDPNALKQSPEEKAFGPRIALLDDTMTEFAGDVQEITILGETGKALLAGQEDKRFFEGSWLHKYNGTYYLSYSTGSTHYLVYATSDKPMGPYTCRGRILEPVRGWTTHHSIVEYKGKWYLFYHDASLSGLDHLRCVKTAELTYGKDGSINPILVP